jgi:hypothetical protein
MAATAPPGLAELLLEEGLLDQASLSAAEHDAQRQGCALVRALVEQGHVGEDELLGMLERRLGLPLADLLHGIDLDALRQVPLDTVERRAVVPMALDRTATRPVLRVAMADPLDHAAIGELERCTGCPIEVELAPWSEITRAIQKFYGGLVTKQIRANVATARPLRFEDAGTESPLERGPKTQPGVRVEQEASPEIKLQALLAALYAKRLLTEEEFKAHLKKLLAEEP